MKSILLRGAALLGALVSAAPVHDRQVDLGAMSEVPRLVIYYQTTHDSDGLPISMLPLVTEKHIALTHLIVCTFHIHSDGTIHLNDFPPDAPLFSTLWNETRVMQSAGVKVMGMVGGAAAGSFHSSTLDGNTTTFENAYSLLHNAIATHNLDGMDLNVEEAMSQAGITRLVQRLRADFGPDFIITQAPVANALMGTGPRNLSGFDYAELERTVGEDIAFYNAQFYNGFGDMRSGRHYDRIMDAGWRPSKVVIGQLTSPANGGGFVPPAQLNATIHALRQKYGEIGGVMGWEYFNSEPGGLREPWRWAQVMTEILRPDGVPMLMIAEGTAEALNRAWIVSAVAGAGVAGVDELSGLTPTVNYMSMVNS
jgi:chitinase